MGAGLVLLAAALPVQAATKPNFIVMMTDDQRWDCLSCAGNTILKTPNMDRIAQGGMRFENMFVVNSLCSPSRATLLSGLYSHANGVLDNVKPKLKPDLKLLPDYLREAGYEVAFCGKSHITGSLRDRKWDYYFGFEGQGNYLNPKIAEGTDGKDEFYDGYMDDIVTDKAVAWLQRNRDKPYCLFLWFKAPHRSWQRARRHHDLFRDVAIPKPDTYDDDLKGYPGKPKAFVEADNKIGGAKHPDTRTLDFVKDYYATLVAVDENVGKILKHLDDSKTANDTAVFFTGDNGFFLGEWRLFDKRLMHEPSIRVPLLVRYPRLVQAGSTTRPMALNVDIMPTVLDLAGVPIPKGLHGRSLVPLLKGENPADWRKDWLYTYYEFPGAHSVKKHRGVRTERYKLIHWHEAPEEWELYDLEKDPGERDNLYGKKEHAALQQRLTKRLEELRTELGEGK
jgi:arylsulfatase A-like enzyme